MSEPPSPQGRSLMGLLPPGGVAAQVLVADWRAAVRAAGDLLVATASTTLAYTDQMLAALDRHGPYIVISPGFALAHAQASDDVLRTGVSFVQLVDSVPFGHATNDPVYLVAGLASTDHDAHLRALHELSMVLSTPEKRARLQAAGSAVELCDLLGIRWAGYRRQTKPTVESSG